MRIFVIVIIGLFLAGSSNNVLADELPSDNQRVIIGFKEEIDENMLEERTYEIHHTFEKLDAVSATVPISSLNELKQHPKVKSVEDEQKVSTETQKVDWGYESTMVERSTEWGLTGEGIKVAVIDTGIDTDHPDLDVVGGENFVEDVNSYDDDNGHGTHVAGVIAAKDNEKGVLGVAPDVDLYGVKSLDDEGEGWEAQIIAGIYWAIDQEMDVINLSLTSCNTSNTMKMVLEEAEAEGISVVAASGNKITCDGEYLEDVMYPARYNSVISVGAIDDNNETTLFSYGGDSLDFVAPGESINSTYIQTESNDSGYETLNGTSMAAPYVSGLAVLYKQAFPHFDANQIKEMLIEHSLDLGEKGKDFEYGHGLTQSLEFPFVDIQKEEWFQSYVNKLYVDKVIKGFEDGEFRPDNKISREEAVTMVGRALELEDAQTTNNPFPDVDSDAYSAGYIASASELGIVEGLPNGEFQPKKSIRRGDIALIIKRAFELTQESGGPTFSDVEDHYYAREAIEALSTREIIKGYPDGTFKPYSYVTRAEFSSLLAKSQDPSFR